MMIIFLGFFLDPLESNHADCRVPSIKMTNNIFKIKNFTTKNAKGAYFFSIRAPFIQRRSLPCWNFKVKSLHIITMHISFSGTGIIVLEMKTGRAPQWKVQNAHYHPMGKINFKWQRKLYLAPRVKWHKKGWSMNTNN